MAKSPNLYEDKVDDTSIREVYHFINRERKIDILSKVIYKQKDKIIHYPFRGDTGEPKYQTIKKIVFNGFKDKLPRGVYKNFIKGYGFTKVLNPLVYYLQDKFKIEKVTVNVTGSSKLDRAKKEVFFSFRDLDEFYPQIKSLFDEQRVDKDNLVKELLGRIFIGEVEATTISYSKNTLYRFIEKWKPFFDEFSKNDINSIVSLFSILNKHGEITDKSVILKTRTEIEELFIEDVIKTFDEYIKQKTETEQLEEKWQIFFKDNNWIFSQLLSFPVILYEDKAYVGGKGVSNTNGKIADFLIQNNLTNNVAFIEIKTHQSDILKKGKPYRGRDVFSISDDLSGAINQVLDQRDNFQKDFYSLKANSKKPVETFNSKCIVLIGMIEGMENEELKSFELFRSNSKDVEIVTYDELYLRLRGLQSLMIR